ncbi:MAG: transcription elongation factor subunit Spt4 [Candidatus Micrarchaeia archaeon]|jgi:DNA-directed RNA polymerase subunit E"
MGLLKACKNCKYLVETEKECPACGEKEFTDKFNGKIYVLDVNSELAQKIGARLPGTYAVRVKR